ncbi:MAG: DUF748 domain-containing protein [Deltaproteobacteria bacterium]|nr:DUF748 domain-containing protein [Deltaproteobacteria bacterium]
MDLKELAKNPVLRRFVLWPAVVLAVYAILGFFLLPLIARSVLVKQLSEKLHRPVTIQAIRINPFALSARVEGFSMKDRDGTGPFVAFEKLYLNLQVASIVRGGPVLREISLHSPSVTLVRNEDSTYNFSDLLGGATSGPSEEGKPLRYSLNNIRIVGGSVDFDDRPKRTRHTVRDLSVAIPFLSSLPYAVEIFVHPSFEANINGTEVAFRGMTKPYSASRETTVDVNVRDFDIPHYLEYIPVQRNFRVPSGSIDAKAVLSFSQPAGQSPTLSFTGTVTLTDLSLTDVKDAPVLRLKSLTAGIGSLEPLARRAILDNVIITSPEVSLVREKTGVLNVVSLLPDRDGEGEAEKEPGPSFSVEIGDLRLAGGNVSYSDLSAPRPFQVVAAIDLSTRFRSVSGEAGNESVLSGLETSVTSLRFRRQEEKEDFIEVPEIGAKGVDVDFTRRTVTIGEVATRKGTVGMTREKDGAIDLAKLFSPTEGNAEETASPPPASSAKKPSPEWLVQVKKAALSDYSVTVVDRTPEDPVTARISQLRVAAEELSTEKNSRGRLSLAATVNKGGKVAFGGALGINPLSAELKVDARTIDLVPFQPYVTDRINISLTEGNISAKGKLALAAQDNTIRTTYAGEFLVSKLATVDKATSEDFLKWDSLHLDGISLGTSPLSVAIREVALTDFYSRLIVTPEGTLNVQGIVRKEEPAPTGETTDTPEPPTPVSIPSVSLQGGRIHFTDYFIKPNYSATLLEIGGRISGLSSEATQMADVNLRGMLENYAPLEITGKINPLRNDLFLDLKADFKDMDLSPLTPYSGRYAGYTIEKGKLSLSLAYRIVERKLTASNNVFLDQFTFGDPVESPDATKLPVRLAVALLKDRNGEIKLDLPVSGSLDDPQFRLGRVILKIIVNLLTKAATSPFALLGAIFGGGEELSYLEFDYGKDTPGETGEAKLKTLAKALHDRPSLKLEIVGHVDSEKDREALRDLLFDRKVRSQKLQDLVSKGGEALSLDNVVVDAKEYPEYLKRAYRAEKFPKPRNFIGMVKNLPVPEMEKLMFTYLQVTDDDLRLLAQRRGQAVKDFLVQSKQVEPERVFLVMPKTLSPEKKEKQRDSRVEFVLK